MPESGALNRMAHRPSLMIAHRQPMVDAALAEAELVSGRAPSQVQRDFGRAAVTSNGRPPSDKPPRWVPWEDRFVRANLGRLSLEQIGERLGRSAIAVKIRYTRRGWRPPSRRRGWLTGNSVAKILAVDVHAVSRWVDEDWIPHRRTPNMRRDIQIHQQALYQWAINPRNWIYFRRERVRDPRLRRLLALRAERWGDEWWTTGQVAKWHGVGFKMVNTRVLSGELPAEKWGNWYVRRSDATAMVFPTRPGNMLDWSDAGDAYMLLCRRRGDPWRVIAKRMKRFTVKQLQYRMQRLQRLGRIPMLEAKFGEEESVEYGQCHN